ncbi:DUF7192 family protein [Lacinutrix chionoecetis]
MSRPQQHTIQSSDGKCNYLLFDSVFAFNAFVDGEIKQLSSANDSRWNWVQQSTTDQLKNGTDWYGTPTPKDITELEAHYTFLGMPLVEKIQPQIKDKLAPFLNYLNEAVLPKPKMTYNDRGLGVFSFDRAAMGLFQQFAVDTQTPMSTSVSQMNIELGNKQIQTSVKSVYAYFQDKQQSYPSLQLYLMAGANANVKGNDLLYVGLACAELVQFMELRGISVEVNVMLGTSFNNQVTMGCVRVKRYQDQLDKNQLLLLSSDPRYFRYRGFKSLVAMSNYFGLTIPSGLGTISASMGNAFAKAVNPKSFVFEQSYSMDTAVKEVSQIITNYKNQLVGKG